MYALYGEGHNECNRKKIGTYKTTVDSFIRAYAVQQAKEAQMRETDYDASEVLQYLSCTAVEVNDSYVSETECTSIYIYIYIYILSFITIIHIYEHTPYKLKVVIG